MQCCCFRLPDQSPMQVTYAGSGPVGANDVWSAFHLAYTVDEGINGCLDASLAGYGQGLVAGQGPPTRAAATQAAQAA